MNVNKKNIFITILFTMIFGVVLVASNVSAQDYTPIERVPWVGGETTTFPEYVTGIYTFAIGVVSIAALLMITIGGFYYITAAGNQAQATTAKKIVTDALLGLIIVFIIWIVLNTINPHLLNANPSMEALRSSVQDIIGQTGVQSTRHSDSRVVQTVTQPQTYCNASEGFVFCYNSKEVCEQSSGTTCVASQNAFSDDKYYSCLLGSPNCVEFESLEECSENASASDCMSGSAAKARMLNNVESAMEINTEIEEAGGEMTENAQRNANEMTEKTVENVKEVIEQSDGGIVTDVDSGGAEYDMQGVSNPSVNGTLGATSGDTIRGLNELYREGAEGDVVKSIERDGHRATYYKYEFSSDHPNEALRGTVATYSVKHGSEDGLVTNEYSDVTIVAAQAIKEPTQNSSQS